MVDTEQRNGESYVEYMIRLRAETERKIAIIDDYIYRLMCKLADNEVKDIPVFSDALSIFIDRKRRFENRLHEIDSVLDSLGINKEDNDEGT